MKQSAGGQPLAADDPKMIALQAHVAYERRGVKLEPGKHWEKCRSGTLFVPDISMEIRVTIGCLPSWLCWSSWRRATIRSLSDLSGYCLRCLWFAPYCVVLAV